MLRTLYLSLVTVLFHWIIWPNLAYPYADTSSPEYAARLIRSFNAFCPTNGTWTLNALAESRKIQKVLESLRDDPECADAANSIGVHVNSLGLALGRMEDTRIERDILARQRQQNDILLLLENEDDQHQRHSLSTLFQSNQLNLSIAKENLRYDKRYARNQYMANVIVNSASNLFEQASLNQKCLLRSPQFLSGLSAIGTSVGSALVSGGASLGLAVASHVLGHALNFIRRSRLNRDIHKLGQGEFISAYQCVMESLSNQWCEARETYDLIDLRMQSKSLQESSFSQGIKILNHDLPVLANWLIQVRSATHAENSAIASVQIEFLNKETMLRTWKIDALGKIGSARRELPDSLLREKDKENQFNVLKALVDSIVPPAPKNTAEESRQRVVLNPVYEVIAPKEIAWKLAGVPIESVPIGKDFSGNLALVLFERMTPLMIQNLETLLPFYPLSPDHIKTNVLDLYNQATARLDEERSETLHADPAFLLGSAEKDTYHIRKISPLKAINNILDYLKSVYGGGLPSCTPDIEYLDNFSQIYAETQSILCQIREQIQDTSSHYNERLKIIFNTSHLYDGETFVSDRVQNVIEHVLTEILIRQEAEMETEQENILQYKLLLANEMIKELRQYGNSNLTQVKFDLVNSLQIVQDTLQNFAEIFAKSIGKTVQQVYERTRGNPLSERLLAKYCSLLLSIPNWNSRDLRRNINLSLCNGQGLRSEWHNQDEFFEFAFNRETYHAPFDQTRICHLRRFLRKEAFYQKYNTEIW